MEKHKTAPKVSMSFRGSGELKDTIINKAASEGMKTSEYLSQVLNDTFLNEKSSDSKDTDNLLFKKTNNQNHPLKFGKRFDFDLSQHLRSSIPVPKLEYTKDNRLIVHIESCSKNEFNRYLAYPKQKYGGSDAEIIFAAIVAATENRRSIRSKPFEYYLKGKAMEKRPTTQNRKAQFKGVLNYPNILKFTLGTIIIFFVFRRLWKWSKS